ncbi:WD40-repeat-containing domain protein, partial [Phellopilus nigrolimitatus]
CMEGTRQKILSQILDWTHMSAQKQIFWLSGLAGAGKSSIASTVAQKLHQEKLLGGCFFCKRDDPVLRDPTRILPTLASRFAQIHRPYAKLLVDILKQDNGVGQQAIQLQFDGLFKGPIEQLQMSKSLASQSPVVFVLDALDECGEVASRRQILTCFLKLQKLVPWIKVFLTSRPTEDISRTFSQASSQAFVFHFPLHEDDAQEDIFLYSQKWIEKMTIEERLPAVWRNNDRTRQLSTKATGLFIWIVTAVTYVEEAVVPEDRLKKLISGSGKGGQTEAELDRLYTLILTDNMGTEDDNRFYFHAVLGTIISVALYRPLPGNALSPLLPSECPDVAIKQVFNRLQSVLYQDGQNQDAIRVCHPSFMDYLTTKDRCSGLGFWIDLHTEDASRALRCLEIVCNGVKFNICDIKSSYVMNDEMPILDLKIKQRIPLVLQYSSLYWTKHLSGALFGSEQIPMVQASLEALLPKTKLLYWLEIVSLTKEIPSLISALPLVVISLKALKLETLSSMARDVYRFVHAFSKPISDSTAHIYISALVWAPKQSSLAAMLTKQFPNIVTIKHGQEINWPLSLLSIKAKSALDCLAFSPNGQQIASGSKDGDVCIWDSRTGAALFQPLASHSDWVTCIAYSPDGQVIASGSKDKTVCIWSAKTGESILEPLTGHRRQITALAYSLDGNLLVSASEDATLRVWDAWNGQLMCKPLSQHELVVTSVAFSPDNLHFASGSRDETVIIWNSKKGAPLFPEPLKGHTDAVTSAVYSPDGRLLATGSEDKSIIIWDIATGKAKHDPITGHTGWVTSVAFSHDGKFIASGARDGTIRVWDSETGLPVTEPLVGHTSYITAISYAPLGQQIASASVDQTIRIWDIGDNAELPVKNQPLMARHTEEITAVAFSDSGDLIVSGSKDTTVRVWDVETGAAKCEAFDGHTNIVKCVAFSPTGSYVASGSDDKTIMIWDLTTKKPVCQPLEHNGFVVSVAYSPNGEYMVSCTPMNTIYVWDVVGKQPVVKSLLNHEGVSCLAVSFDGKQLASGSSLGDVRIWNVDEREVIHRIPEHTDSVKSVGFSSDPLDRQVMSCSDDKSVFIWDSMTGALVHKIDAAEDCHGITKGSFSPDGKTVAFGPHFRAQLQWSNPSDFPLSLWDVASGTMHMFLGHEQLIRSVAYSKDGARLVTCSDDKTIRVW